MILALGAACQGFGTMLRFLLARIGSRERIGDGAPGTTVARELQMETWFWEEGPHGEGSGEG